MTSGPAPAAEPQLQPLPQLREDIRLTPDAPDLSGAQAWRLHDPVRDIYYALGPEAFDLISQWPLAANRVDLARRVLSSSGRHLGDDEIKEFSAFLAQAQLLEDPPGGWRHISERADKARTGLAAGLMHNYLFFKVPLLKPHEMLTRTLPAVRWLVHPVTVVVWAMLTLAGVYLASRQVGEFSDGLARLFSLSGAALFAITLFTMKLAHELGHAYVATAMGCRVRSMGLAVMLLAPMLYTDVSDSWRLSDRRKRIAIDMAGVATEMAIAGLAILAWALMPPGTSRDVALVIATAAVVMTLAINLSPFMRFDGYYILSDLIGVKNLQSRAFQLVRWQLREVLFGLGEPAPDPLQGRMRTLVILYGVITMIYRLVLFTGIAVAVYLMSFKALGIILFIIEIFYFILRPVLNEIKGWQPRAARLAASPRTWLSAGVVGGALACAVVPWSTTVRIPAVLENASFARLMPPLAAEIDEILVADQAEVEAGQVLVRMVSPRLEKELAVTAQRLALVDQRLARRIGDSRDQSTTLALDSERAALVERQSALARQIDALSIRAPIAGRVAGLDPDLHKGRLLSRDDEIGVIVGPGGQVVRGYADQQDLWRLSIGNRARFVADQADKPIVLARLSSVAVSSSHSLDIPQLAETYGGQIRVAPPSGKQQLVPLDPVHLVDLTPARPGLTGKPVRGVVLVDGKAQSLMAVLTRRIMQVLIQEAGA